MAHPSGVKKRTRCAIYTRKSSEEGLEQTFNPLHAQREACEAYILSQRHEQSNANSSQTLLTGKIIGKNAGVRSSGGLGVVQWNQIVVFCC